MRLNTPPLRGWVANEIFRRVHPEGSTIGDLPLKIRTHKHPPPSPPQLVITLKILITKCPQPPGEYLRSKVSEPLGARAFIGVHEDELGDYAPTREVGLGFLFGNSLLPKSLGSGVDLNFIELCALFNNFRKMMGDFKPPYKEQDFSKGIGAFYNQAINIPWRNN